MLSLLLTITEEWSRCFEKYAIAIYTSIIHTIIVYYTNVNIIIEDIQNFSWLKTQHFACLLVHIQGRKKIRCRSFM